MITLYNSEGNQSYWAGAMIVLLVSTIIVDVNSVIDYYCSDSISVVLFN